MAQTEAPKAQLGRVIGVVTAKDASGKQLTVKSDAGADYTVTLEDKTVFLRVPPGEKDLKKATKITAGDVNVGDRVMARGNVSEEQKTVPAVSVIVMTKEDLAQKQARETAEWQTSGASGIVKSVSPDGKEIVVANNTRQGVTSLTTISVGPNAKVRRYAPDSVRFADAKPAAVSDIQPGDLVRARGEKNADGTRVEAADLVFGTFRTMAGTVISVDPANNEIKLNDLDTKKPVTVKLNPEAQVKKLPPMAAMMLARRLNPAFQGGAGGPGGPGGGGQSGFRPGAGGGGAGAGGGGGRPEGAQGQGGQGQGQWRRPEGGGQPGPAAGVQDASQRAGAGAPPAGPDGEQRPRMGGGGNLEQMLERMPAVPLSEIQPGEPLIVSTTSRAGSPVANATTVLAGVEPILRGASPGSVNLGSWSLELNMPTQ